MPYATRMPKPASFFFFFNDTATTEIYTLSLHDALPILRRRRDADGNAVARLALSEVGHANAVGRRIQDRKSTRLNSSHDQISHAVFCLKKKFMLSVLQLYEFHCLLRPQTEPAHSAQRRR